MKKLIKTIIKLYKTYKQLTLYLLFGICTTAINTICYWALYDILSLSNILSNILAWITAVIFAFLTNKMVVFESKKTSTMQCISEIVFFFGCRAATGILDLLIMAVAVDLLNWNGLLWKLISNIVVIILNYIASKFLIFRK